MGQIAYEMSYVRNGDNYLYGTSAKFRINKVIFSGPCTIVFWKDGTKTVVKCHEGDTYDPEKAIAMCYMKKAVVDFLYPQRLDDVIEFALKDYKEREQLINDISEKVKILKRTQEQIRFL